MTDWHEICGDKLKSWREAIKAIKSGDKVVATIGTAQPSTLVVALLLRKDELENVKLCTNCMRHFPYLEWKRGEPFSVDDPFVHRFYHQAVREKRIEYMPLVFGMVDRPGSFACEANIGLIKVTPPNSDGYCSYGPEVWYAPVLVKNSSVVLAEIDPEMIWTCGEKVHVSEIDLFVERDPSLENSFPSEFDDMSVLQVPPADAEIASVIGAHVASLIKDGDTIEIGTGVASEAAIEFLSNKNDLGIDSELIFPKIIDLIKKGVITNRRKNRNKGKALCASVYAWPTHPGGQEALEYVNHNPAFELYNVAYICNIPRIAANKNQVAINAILGIDLLGQALVDHLGTDPWSGMGGQFDFTMGAQLSKGGRSITTLISTAKQGTISRIVPQFEKGTVIGLPYYTIDYLVTEHGIANLRGKNRRERAEAIISIAHPKFIEELQSAARKLF